MDWLEQNKKRFYKYKYKYIYIYAHIYEKIWMKYAI